MRICISALIQRLKLVQSQECFSVGQYVNIRKSHGLLPNLSSSYEGVGVPYGRPHILSILLCVGGGLFVPQGGIYIISTSL